jgi:KaiC/GvpD/RAD55 family RecA-like ATPase
MISDNTYKKFVETFDVTDWEIETDTGWSDIKEIGKTIEYDEWVLETVDGLSLICADKHIVFDNEYNEVFVMNLKQGDKILTKNGISIVSNVYTNGLKSNMYDLSLDDLNHRFYTNDILSHNSMWLQNIATKMVDNGHNVVYVTLEMASRKCMKRMGAMRLKIPIDDYDTLAKDSMYMKQKINEAKNNTSSNSLFDGGKAGRLFVKKYPTSDCTVTDLENYIIKFKETKGVKLDAVVIDYINLMSIEKGMNMDNMLYLKGKHLAEGLRRIADKHDVAIITATQTGKDVWGANDINLSDIPESKAIAESADSVWGIIRNEIMKKENTYRLKILKLRDGEHHEEQIKFDFHQKYLTMDNDIQLTSTK